MIKNIKGTTTKTIMKPVKLNLRIIVEVLVVEGRFEDNEALLVALGGLVVGVLGGMGSIPKKHVLYR